MQASAKGTREERNLCSDKSSLPKGTWKCILGEGSLLTQTHTGKRDKKTPLPATSDPYAEGTKAQNWSNRIQELQTDFSRTSTEGPGQSPHPPSGKGKQSLREELRRKAKDYQPHCMKVPSTEEKELKQSIQAPPL